MIRDVNAVTADLERAFVCAEIGLDLEHVRQVARDAVDSGRHYRDVWLSEGDVKQSRLANQLVDVGETLSEIVGMRQRARLNNRLDAQIRLATANGLKLKVATNGRVYSWPGSRRCPRRSRRAGTPRPCKPNAPGSNAKARTRTGRARTPRGAEDEVPPG